MLSPTAKIRPRSTAKGNWQLERQIGFAYTRQVGPGLVVLGEYYHLKTNQFIYSIDQAEFKGLNPVGSFISSTTPNRWTSGSWEVYVFPVPGEGRVPLHRFSNGKDWLFSTERDDAAA
jgi:hypothetical protein